MKQPAYFTRTVDGKVFNNFNDLATAYGVSEGTEAYEEMKRSWDTGEKLWRERTRGLNNTSPAGVAAPDTLDTKKNAFNTAARGLRAAEGAVRALTKLYGSNPTDPQQSASMALAQADAVAAKTTYNAAANALNQLRRPVYSQIEKAIITRFRGATTEERNDIMEWAGINPHGEEDVI